MLNTNWKLAQGAAHPLGRRLGPLGRGQRLTCLAAVGTDLRVVVKRVGLNKLLNDELNVPIAFAGARSGGYFDGLGLVGP